MSECQHATWRDGYYGHECADCGEFMCFYGAEPWVYLTPEEEEQLAREEAFYSGWGVCIFCGGERGDGWSTCRCEEAWS